MKFEDVKKQNRNNVYRVIYESKKISKPDIAGKLCISVPSVSQYVTDLKEMGLISDEGFYESTGGRKAAVISCIADAKIAIGVQILRDKVHLTAIDLYGNILKTEDLEIPFKRDDAYCAFIGNAVTVFFISLDISNDKLLGVGIAIQGLVDHKTQKIIFGPLADSTGFSMENFKEFIPFPCTLRHDTESSANYALWLNEKAKNALYFVLNKDVGGVLVINGSVFYSSKLPSGLIAHMTIVPGGLPCYCGKKGCVNAYCSPAFLLAGFHESLDEFFLNVRVKEKRHSVRWAEYLHYVAAAIYNYQVILGTEVVIDGDVAKYMNDEDIKKLEEMVIDGSTLADRFPNISLSKEYDAAAGAALFYIKDFLKQFGITN